jgi:hypothetical protein
MKQGVERDGVFSLGSCRMEMLVVTEGAKSWLMDGLRVVVGERM